ncbi:MAG: hypothetical protein AB7S26_16720 [Sandaracinaceae bacterium]
MLGGLITIAGGLIAASNLVVSRMANAKTLIDKLTPYQGWIGMVMFGWGVWETISSVTGIGLLSTAPLTWVFWLCVALADLFVGFLLGFGLITKYALSKNEQAMQKGQQIRGKLAPFQGMLGIFAVVMGVLYLVWLYVL